MSCNSPFPKLDKFSRVVYIPCGKCSACKKDYINMWSDRWDFETLGKRSYFVTLTYDDEHLTIDRQIHKIELQNFFKRLRKYVECPIKYISCGEYGNPGGGFRPHYHFVICSDSNVLMHAIEKSWTNGFITIKPANSGAVRYVLKYIVKQKDCAPVLERCEELGYEKPFMLCSKGIGKSYMLTHADELIRNGGYYRNGKLRPLPRYYKDGLGIKTKLYNQNRKYELISEYMKAHSVNSMTARYALGVPAELEAIKLSQLKDKEQKI